MGRKRANEPLTWKVHILPTNRTMIACAICQTVTHQKSPHKSPNHFHKKQILTQAHSHSNSHQKSIIISLTNSVTESHTMSRTIIWAVRTMHPHPISVVKVPGRRGGNPSRYEKNSLDRKSSLNLEIKVSSPAGGTKLSKSGVEISRYWM